MMGYANRRTKIRRHNHFYSVAQKLTLLGVTGAHSRGWPGDNRKMYSLSYKGEQIGGFNSTSLLQQLAEMIGVENERRPWKAIPGDEHLYSPPYSLLGGDVLFSPTGGRTGRFSHGR